MQDNQNSGKDIVKAAMSQASKPGTLAGLNSSKVKTVIQAMSAQIAQAVPKHITADRIIQLATTYVTNNPQIAECSAASIVGAIMQTSILGFEPIPALGQVYFVPRKNKKKIDGKEVWIDEVCFQIGYKGYIRLAYNSGEVESIYAEEVRKGDIFSYSLGTDYRIDHIPNPEGTGEEEITHVYAVAKYKGGGKNFVVLPKSRIEFYRKLSATQRNGLSGFWQKHYAAMAKKTAIHRLATYLPLSIESQKMMATDGAIFNEKSFTNNKSGLDLSAADFVQEEAEDAVITEGDNATPVQQTQDQAAV